MKAQIIHVELLELAGWNKYSQLWNHGNIFIYGTSVLTRTNIHPTFAYMNIEKYMIIVKIAGGLGKSTFKLNQALELKDKYHSTFIDLDQFKKRSIR